MAPPFISRFQSESDVRYSLDCRRAWTDSPGWQGALGKRRQAEAYRTSDLRPDTVNDLRPQPKLSSQAQAVLLEPMTAVDQKLSAIHQTLSYLPRPFDHQ